MLNMRVLHFNEYKENEIKVCDEIIDELNKAKQIIKSERDVVITANRYIEILDKMKKDDEELKKLLFVEINDGSSVQDKLALRGEELQNAQ